MATKKPLCNYSGVVQEIASADAVAIADGGTGQITAQAAIDALTNVSAATNEHVLTKDTATGNAIFKASAGASADEGLTMWSLFS